MNALQSAPGVCRHGEHAAPRALAIAASLLASFVLGASAADAQVPDPGGDAGAPVPVPPPDRFFGLNGGTRMSQRDFSSAELAQLARGAGANAIRGVLSWQAVEPARDRWSDATWEPFDGFYTGARAAGLTPIMVLGAAPSWARPLVGRLCFGPSCSFPPRPAMDGEWAQFAAEAARRYPDAIFEVWNEPNLPRYWQLGPDPHRYARLQVLAYDAIKRVDPGATVLSAGFANVPPADLLGGLLGRMGLREFVSRAYAGPSSIKGHMDALAFHPYPGRPSLRHTAPPPDLGPDSGFARGFAEIRAVKDRAGDSDTPLFVTETGISTLEGVTLEEQVVATQRIYRKTLTMDDVIGIVFHRLHSPAQLAGAREAGFAWLAPGDHPPPPRPVYCAFAAEAGASYAGC